MLRERRLRDPLLDLDDGDVLKDFVLGEFATCESALITTPESGGEAITTALSIGDGSVDVTDSAF